MKVREYLYEKFTDETDPIQDMNIGLAAKLKRYLLSDVLLNAPEKDFIERNFWKRSATELYMMIDTEENRWPGFVEVLEDYISDKNTKLLSTLNFRFRGASGSYRIEEFSFFDTLKGKILRLKDGADTYFIGDIETAVNVNLQALDESLNEKFTDDSDAIHDMGIGMDKLIRDFMRNDIEEYQDDDDPETKNKDTILGYSVIYEKEDFVDYLISKGANINNKSVNNWFKFACKYDHIEPIKLLIKKGFNFHGSPGEGWEKGLRIAIANDHLEVVKILIEAGADPEVVDGKPVRIAIANNNMPILKYLKEKGVKIAKWEYFKLANEYKVRAMTDFIGQEIKAEKKRKIRKFFRLKESLYEKFEEESDPISDMGIGGIDIHEYIRELVNKGDGLNFNKAHEFLKSLIGKKISGKFRRGLLLNQLNDEGTFTFIITDYSLYEKQETLIFKDAYHNMYIVFWEQRYHINHNLYEKFEEESDPISDMGIGHINIHAYIRELVSQNKNFDRAFDKVYEFLSSLIGKKITGNFKKAKQLQLEVGSNNYAFTITRYTLNTEEEKLVFEDDKGYTYLVMWGEKYHIS